MRNEVTVSFKNQAPVQIDLSDLPPMSTDAAHRWLDEQFTQMGCDPLRPTGKLLTADRIVVVAQAGGSTQFSNAVWAQEFALAATAALGKPLVSIDVSSLSISY